MPRPPASQSMASNKIDKAAIAADKHQSIQLKGA